jgi:YfiH family protein
VVVLRCPGLRLDHGTGVASVRGPADQAGATADAAVTGAAGCALAVLTADCAPVALASPEGVIGVAHAGWRGAVAGVVEATVAAMRELGATDVRAMIGPCIRPGCYAFGEVELGLVADRLGPAVRAVTTTGRPALDLPAAVRAALGRAGVGPDRVVDVGACTACSPAYFSWRAGKDLARQATVIWR